jgi:hypothetical protein
MAEHVARFALIKANGETKRIGDPHKITAPPSKISGAPRGFNIIAQMSVVPTSLGTAFIQVVIDEHEIARLPFTVALQEQQSEGGDQ